MRETKFRVWSVSDIDNKTVFVGYERLRLDGNWEYKRENRPEYVLGTISDNQGNVKFVREQLVAVVDGGEFYVGDRIRVISNSLGASEDEFFTIESIMSKKMIGTLSRPNTERSSVSLEIVGGKYKKNQFDYNDTFPKTKIKVIAFGGMLHSVYSNFRDVDVDVIDIIKEDNARLDGVDTKEINPDEQITEKTKGLHRVFS